jgi:ectoine hydroxylase-related dioxygenase (phytanoyl-CoA dioxygenase family)
MDTLTKYTTNGFVVIENAVSKNVIEEYNQLWEKENSQQLDEHGRLVGWGESSAYTKYDEIKNVLCSDAIFDTFNEIELAVALHLDITYNTSTLKGWHQDCALPNKEAANNYAGCWVALEDISPDSGPFEIIVGSHAWDIDYNEIYELKGGGRTNKPGVNINSFFNNQIEKRNAEIFTFVPKKGDALIWHGYSVHRGSIPNNNQLTRKSLIGHYCNNFANFEQIGEVEFAMAKTALLDPHFGQWGKGHYFKAPMEGYDD